MKEIIIHQIEKIHLKIFGHLMGLEMKKFIGNLSWSFFIGIFVVPLTMMVTTLAGRFMGPAEYGKYSLLLVVNQFLLILIFFGLDTTSVKYIAKAKSFEDKQRVISSITYFIVKISIFIVFLSLVIYPLLLKYYRDYSLFVIVLSLYTLTIATKIILDLAIRGLEDFKKQAKAKVLEITVALTVFAILFIILKQSNFISLIIVMSAAALAISLYYYRVLFKYFGKKDGKVISQQFSEGKLFFISALSGTIFMSSDKLIIAKYLGVEVLGIYSAYYMASFGVVSQTNQLFTNVFFPITSRLENKNFTKKIDKLLLIGFLPLSVLFGLVMLVVLMVFGKEYPIDIRHIIGFSIFSSLYFFQALYNTVIADISRAKYKKYLAIRNYVNAVTVVMYLAGVYFNILSISLIIACLVLNLIITLIIQQLFIKSMQSN